MGAVFRALDRESGALAAVKVLWAHCLEQPEQAERFAREARVLQSLAHPGIVRYLTHGTTPEDEPWLAIEWLDGENLSQRLRRKGLSLVESVGVTQRVAEALAVAHRRGVIHRDLKPSNLYLVERSIAQPKIIDFGIAKVEDGSALTLTGVVMGTPYYMAPEQARGVRTIDTRTDVFSLGCVLFHCLTGRPPFAGAEAHAALLKVVLDDAPRLSDLCPDAPRALDVLLARMLARDPDARPVDAGEVAFALGALNAVELTDAAPLSLRGGVLTGRELRVVCAVIARLPAPRPSEETTPTTLPATLPMGSPDPRRVAISAAATRSQGRTVEVAGAWIITLPASRTARDQAAQAARCALAIREAVPDAMLAVVGGRGAATIPTEASEVVGRGLRLIESTVMTGRGSHAGSKPPAGLIRIDELVAGLLGARFVLGGDSSGLILAGERDTGPAPRTVLGRATPCVGRDHELAVLEAVFAECEAEPCARAVLVTGEAGIGKSRLGHEFQRRVLGRGAQVWIAQGDPMSEGSPFGMLGQMLRREAGVLEGEPRDVRYQKLRARVGRHVSPPDATRIAQFLGQLAGAPCADCDTVEMNAARADPVLMGDQMRRAWEDLLLAESQHGPILLVLEDLHWGDVPTIKFVDAALRNLGEAPLMVLSLARPVVRDLFPKLWAERGLAEIHLLELGRRGSERLARSVLGDAADPALVARIVDRAAGNPFYLEEMLRAAAEGSDTDLPEAVLAMAEARLEALDPEARRVLRAASIFGQVFWRGGILALLGGERSAPTLDASLAQLTEREMIARCEEARFPGETAFRFRHSLLREAAYAMLPAAERTLGHRTAASWLETTGEREALVLAEHFERGGAPERAVTWFRRAAEQALEGDDFMAAITRAERGAGHAKGDLLGALRLIQVEAHRWRGSAADAERCAVEAMAAFPVGSARWYVAASEAASMRLRLGRHEQLSDLAAEVRAVGLATAAPAGASTVDPLATSASGMGAAVSAVARLAGSLLHDGQHALAEALIVDIDRVAGPLGESDFRVAARIWALHASRALCYGDPASALHFTELSIPTYAYTGDRRNACLCRVNAAHAVLQLGDAGMAERALRSALSDAERMGLLNVSALARQNLGVALARQGQLDEARSATMGAITAFVAQSNRRQEGRSRAYLAEILAARGDLDGADREARSAVRCLASIPPLKAFALGVLSTVLLSRERARAGVEAAREGIGIREALAGMEEGEARLRLAYAECLTALHDPAANEALRSARARILTRAAQIADRGFRASFVRRVPENARTLDLSLERFGPLGTGTPEI